MYVGAFKRILAAIIDGIIIGGVFIICMVVINTIFAPGLENSYYHIVILRAYAPEDVSSYQKIILFLYYATAIAFPLIYETLFVFSRFSGTPGKIIMKIEVSCYKNASFLKVVIRTLTKAVFSYTGITIIEFFVVVFNKKKQSFHDMLSSTVVTYKEASFVESKDQNDLIIQQLESGNIKTYDEVVALKERLPQAKSRVYSSTNSRIWWLLVIAMLAVSIGFMATNYKTLIQDEREVTESVTVRMDESNSQQYEGTWNNKEWILKFTYKNGELKIFDSNGIFREYSLNIDNTLFVKDYNGQYLIIKRSGDELVARYDEPIETTGNIKLYRSYKFTRETN